MSTFTLCAEFHLIPPGTYLPTAFVHSAFTFRQRPSTHRLRVLLVDGEHAMGFPREGVDIDLPAPRKIVHMRVGAGATPVSIEGLGSSGAAVVTVVVPHGPAQDIKLETAADDIVAVALTNGNSEGFLVRICVDNC